MSFWSNTNVLVYAIDEDSQFHSWAQEILFEVDFELFTSSKNLSELLTVVTRGEDTPLSIDQALDVVQDIVACVTVLYPTQHTYEVFQSLLQKYKPRGLKIHDFETASIAIGNGITYLATANEKDFAEIDMLKIMSLSST